MNRFFKRIVLLPFVFYSSLLLASEPQTFIADSRLQKLLPEFERYAETARVQWNLPGMAIGIVKDNKLVYAKGFGVKKTGVSDPVDPHTVFQIGSLTKAFTVALTAQLIDQGKLAWRDRVVDHMPTFEMYDPYVTREFMIEDLYAQHSGMATFSGDLQYVLGYDVHHIIQNLRNIKPVTSFRSTYSYVNSLFLVGAALSEKITGKTWESLIQENIFNPLGMSESSIGLNDYLKNKNTAGLHLLLGNKITLIPNNNLLTKGIYEGNAPAGGINSNVIDLSKWMIMQLNDGHFNGKQIISKENIIKMHMPTTLSSSFLDGWSYYALGWSYADGLAEPIVSHNGETAGAKSMLLLAPKSKVGIIILANNRDTLLPEALAYQFIDMYFGNKKADWNKIYFAGQQKISVSETTARQASLVVANHQAALPLSTYLGTYLNKIYNNVQVIEKQNQLALVIGPKNISIPLQHLTGNIFILKTPPELLNAFDTIDNPQVIFNVAANGEVTSMKIPLFAQDSDGEFLKNVKSHKL